MQRDIQPFTYDLYVSFFMRPKLVDKDGRECKVDFVYCDTDSTIKDIYFVRKCDRARLKADDIFIVIPTKEELDRAEQKAEEREKDKKKQIDYWLGRK